LTSGQKIALFKNMDLCKNTERLEELSKITVNADLIYNLIVTTTEDTEKAEDIRSQWLETFGEDAVNLQAVAFAKTIAHIIGADKNAI
jgi:hypothetical protein